MQTAKPGPVPVPDVHKLRGASEFAAKAGVVLLLEGEGLGPRALKVAKNWFGPVGEVVVFSRSGEGLEALDAGAVTDPVSAGDRILRLLEAGPKTRGELVAALAEEYKPNTVDVALASLRQERKIKQLRRGLYALAGQEDQENQASPETYSDQVPQATAAAPEPKLEKLDSGNGSGSEGGWPPCPSCGAGLGPDDWLLYRDCPGCRAPLPSWQPNGAGRPQPRP